MNRPAPVEVSYKGMRFLITHNPTNATLSTFVQVSGRPHVPHASLVSVAGGGGGSGLSNQVLPFRAELSSRGRGSSVGGSAAPGRPAG